MRKDAKYLLSSTLFGSAALFLWLFILLITIDFLLL